MNTSFRLLSSLLVFSALILGSTGAHAQARRTKSMSSDQPSRLSYDLSASAGSYNGANYTELTLGLNWSLQEWLTWRNSIFSRQSAGSDSIQGLDSSMRLSTNVTNDAGTLGFDAFAGPGVRLANKDNNALFGEAGIVFRLGGIRIGGGVKALTYIANRDDGVGGTLPKGDTQYFLIIAGGGTL